MYIRDRVYGRAGSVTVHQLLKTKVTQVKFSFNQEKFLVLV